MAGFTNAVANAILKDYFPSGTVITQNVYVGLSTTTPDEDGKNVTEPAASTGYARAGIITFDYSKNKQIANSDYIFIFESFGDAGTATHVILSKTKTGTPFFIAPLDPPLTILNGYVPLIRPYKLKIALDKEVLETYPSEKNYSG